MTLKQKTWDSHVRITGLFTYFAPGSLHHSLRIEDQPIHIKDNTFYHTLYPFCSFGIRSDALCQSFKTVFQALFLASYVESRKLLSVAAVNLAYVHI